MDPSETYKNKFNSIYLNMDKVLSDFCNKDIQQNIIQNVDIIYSIPDIHGDIQVFVDLLFLYDVIKVDKPFNLMHFFNVYKSIKKTDYDQILRLEEDFLNHVHFNTELRNIAIIQTGDITDGYRNYFDFEDDDNYYGIFFNKNMNSPNYHFKYISNDLLCLKLALQLYNECKTIQKSNNVYFILLLGNHEIMQLYNLETYNIKMHEDFYNYEMSDTYPTYEGFKIYDAPANIHEIIKKYKDDYIGDDYEHDDYGHDDYGHDDYRYDDYYDDYEYDKNGYDKNGYDNFKKYKQNLRNNYTYYNKNKYFGGYISYIDQETLDEYESSRINSNNYYNKYSFDNELYRLDQNDSSTEENPNVKQTTLLVNTRLKLINKLLKDFVCKYSSIVIINNILFSHTIIFPQVKNYLIVILLTIYQMENETIPEDIRRDVYQKIKNFIEDIINKKGTDKHNELINIINKFVRYILYIIYQYLNIDDTKLEHKKIFIRNAYQKLGSIIDSISSIFFYRPDGSDQFYNNYKDDEDDRFYFDYIDIGDQNQIFNFDSDSIETTEYEKLYGVLFGLDLDYAKNHKKTMLNAFKTYKVDNIVIGHEITNNFKPLKIQFNEHGWDEKQYNLIYSDIGLSGAFYINDGKNREEKIYSDLNDKKKIIIYKFKSKENILSKIQMKLRDAPYLIHLIHNYDFYVMDCN